MNNETLSPGALKRGDIVVQSSGSLKLIIRQVSDGQVFTVEKGKDRKGPVLDTEGLREYRKFNTGENDSDEYREHIIKTYLERHKNKESSASAKSKYQKKRTAAVTAYMEVEKKLAPLAEQEGVSIADYILLAAEFYEQNKSK